MNFLKDAIRPNGSPECGNHIAARKYSSSHVYFHDFTPPPKSEYPNSNYTDFVADKFKSERYMSGGTDTAGAINFVRTVDIQRARGNRTFIMVFTDGRSANTAATVEEARLLHPLVEEVYAFGIGTGIDELELEDIASNPDNWAVMNDFTEYKEFIRLFMLGLSQGCAASVIQPYRIIDLKSSEYVSKGVSDKTINEYRELECLKNCPEHPETNRTIHCARCSQRIAALHLQDMEIFRHNITEAANAKCFNAALLAGFISRQTQAGTRLHGTNGSIPCDNSANENCFGIMHMKQNMSTYCP